MVLHTLPTNNYYRTRQVTTADPVVEHQLAGDGDISPRMYGRYVHPYYCEIAEPFGLTYYGCCEPVHDIWDQYVSKLPHLRKVSISAWYEEYMGEALRGSGVIYSRKPSPNFVGVGTSSAKKASRPASARR